MVALRSLLVAAVLLSASCTSIFDSYYSNSLEYLETQADLSQVVGGKTIIAVHMQVLPAATALPKDLLVVIVDTSDGQQTVVFYDENLKKIKSFSQSTLTTANGGTPPDLYPIMQDSSGYYTGQIAYSPSSGQIGSASLSGFTITGTQSLSQFQSMHYALGGVSTPVLISNSTLYANATTTNDSIIGLSSAGIGFPGGVASANVMAATSWAGTFYVLYTANGSGSPYVMQVTPASNSTVSGLAAMSTGTPAVASLKGNNNNGNFSQGWVTIRGAILGSHSDNATLLHAIDWSGTDKGTVNLPDSSNGGSTLSLAFHPNGQYWYFFDPSNGRISKFKAWW